MGCGSVWGGGGGEGGGEGEGGRGRGEQKGGRGRDKERGGRGEFTLVNIARGRPAVLIDKLVGDSTGSTVNAVSRSATAVSIANPSPSPLCLEGGC